MTIRERVAPIIAALEQQRSGLRVSDPGSGPLTWANLDARVDELVAELDGAISRDDLQDVGRRSREILINGARLLADQSLVPAGQAPPKAADAKAWLDLSLTARAARVIPRQAHAPDARHPADVAMPGSGHSQSIPADSTLRSSAAHWRGDIWVQE